MVKTSNQQLMKPTYQEIISKPEFNFWVPIIFTAGSIYAKDSASLQFDCSSTATVDRVYKLVTTGTTSYLDFSAEL